MTASDTNKDIVAAFIEAVNDRAYDRLPELMAEQITLDGQPSTRDYYVQQYLAARDVLLAEARLTVEGIEARGADLVVLYGQLTATPRVPPPGMPQQLTPGQAATMMLFHLDAGRIVALREVSNSGGLYAPALVGLFAVALRGGRRPGEPLPPIAH